MKTINVVKIIVGVGILFASCTADITENENVVQPKQAKVQFVLPGRYGDFLPRKNETATRVAYPTDDETKTQLESNPTHPFPDGSTLWLMVKNTTTNEDYVKSFVVHRNEGDENSYLYQCTVDADGKVKEESGSPFFIEAGSYEISAVSPALPLNDDGALTVDNGQYLIASDKRYTKTDVTKFTVTDEDTGKGSYIKFVKLNPLINQTAQLKFTLYYDTPEGYIHSCELLPTGVEISGLQKPLLDGNTWNWKLGTPLVPSYSDKTEKYVVHDYESDGSNIIVNTGILPTYAISQPLVVLFNLKVNGQPTVFQTQLPEKNFKAGYTYHYKGKISISNGVTVITWQNVIWSTNVSIGDTELAPQS